MYPAIAKVIQNKNFWQCVYWGFTRDTRCKNAHVARAVPRAIRAQIYSSLTDKNFHTAFHKFIPKTNIHFPEEISRRKKVRRGRRQKELTFPHNDNAHLFIPSPGARGSLSLSSPLSPPHSPLPTRDAQIKRVFQEKPKCLHRCVSLLPLSLPGSPAHPAARPWNWSR